MKVMKVSMVIKALRVCCILFLAIHSRDVLAQDASHDENSGQITDSIRRKLAGAGTDIAHKVDLLNLLADRLSKDSTNQAIEYAHQAYLLTLENRMPEQQGKALLNLATGYLYNDF